ALSATIAAHELGHLSGLEHGDAFGPIGAGVFGRIRTDPNRQFLPAYPGPFSAVETPYHLMASPDSIRTDLFVAAGNPFFGERDAVQPASPAHGPMPAESAADHSPIAPAHPLPLTNLFVPNALLGGLNAGQDFAVRAADVVGWIQLRGPAGARVSEDDY